jgi:hypothetical protein
MTSVDQPLDRSEFVLVAQVPKAGGRWHQVHFNKDVMWEFFRLKKGATRKVSLERVDSSGTLEESVARQLVLSETNLNPKIEFDFGLHQSKRRDYPVNGVPLLLVLELDLRTFRYQTLMPEDAGHSEMMKLNHELPSIGRGLPRGISTLDEVELRWPSCKLRSPKRRGRSG